MHNLTMHFDDFIKYSMTPSTTDYGCSNMNSVAFEVLPGLAKHEAVFSRFIYKYNTTIQQYKTIRRCFGKGNFLQFTKECNNYYNWTSITDKNNIKT